MRSTTLLAKALTGYTAKEHEPKTEARRPNGIESPRVDKPAGVGAGPR